MPERLGRVLMPKVTERKQREEVARRLGELPTRHMDLLLPGAALFLVGYGILIIYSASHGISHSYVWKQVIAVIMGLAFGALMLSFDYRRLKVATPFLYGGVMVLLVLVLFWTEIKGSSGWFTLGPVSIQPSEYAKLALILTLANLLSDNKYEPDSFRFFAMPVAWTLPYVFLVLLEPDLGTAMVYVAILLSMLFLAGVRMRYWFGLVGAGVLAFAVGIFFNILTSVQLERLTAFLSQGSEIKSAGYQLAQSKIAIGSGQVTGKGLLKGTQTNLNFLPERHTDFIFSVVGEELGLVGGLVLIFALCFLLWRCLMVANNSRDFYGTYIAVGIIAMFAFQMVVNIGMTMGIMPITGIPLPFISYGGTSMIVSLMSVALLVNVNMHRFSQL